MHPHPFLKNSSIIPHPFLKKSSIILFLSLYITCIQCFLLFPDLLNPLLYILLCLSEDLAHYLLHNQPIVCEVLLDIFSDAFARGIVEGEGAIWVKAEGGVAMVGERAVSVVAV